MKYIISKLFASAALSLVLAVLPSQACFAQSTDPDAPTVLTESAIEGMNSSNMSEDNTYYYAFDVNKGTLSLTLDVIPTNRSDAGGLLQWTLMSTKFQKLKYDNLSAQGSPERQMKDMPVTVKRRVILKLVVSGNAGYKIKLSGSAVNFDRKQ